MQSHQGPAGSGDGGSSFYKAACEFVHACLPRCDESYNNFLSGSKFKILIFVYIVTTRGKMFVSACVSVLMIRSECP